MSQRSVCSGVKWGQLCSLLDKIKAAKRPAKKELLSNFMQSYRAMLQKHRRDNVQSEESFFPVMRVLLPALDRERGAYGVKEKKLADLYIKILGIKKDSPDAVKLINYRKPKTAGASMAGDFAEVAFYVLRNRCPAEGSLTLQDVDCKLTHIAVQHAARHNEAVNETMLSLLRSMTAKEQKWLIRVLLKDMQLGLGQTAIFSTWHPDAKDYYDVNNSLSKVCSTLRDPSVRLHEIEVSIFSAFRPMLAERAVLEKVETQMKNKVYVAENKFDGERSQMHMKQKKFMYFSRNGFDFTTNFGASPTSGSLTPHLAPLIAPNVDEVIIDGEVVCWHKTHEVIIPKGESYDVKNLREDGPLQVCFCAFDILLLNGRVLTNLPLKERREILKTVVKEKHGRVIISVQEEVRLKADVVRALNAAIDRREEGLVLKDPDSVYRPAARTAGWIKVKPDYVDSLVPELDLVIIGGFYGVGKQHGLISHFLLGAADSETISDGGRITSVVSVCRVGSGYTTEELSVLSSKLAPCSSRQRPECVFAFSKDKPDVWFNPSKSVVVQVRAAEVSVSKSYGAQLTLRFPRVEIIRSDKSWQDILKTAELKQLRENAGGKLALHHYNEDEHGGPSPKKGPGTLQTPSTSKHPALAQHNTPADISKIRETSDFLKGKEICVVESEACKSKQELEKIIAEAGGTFTQHPSTSTFCVICNSLTVRSMNLSMKHCIIKPDWLLQCKKYSKLLSWGPLDVVSLLPEYEQQISRTHDTFGDSYTQDVDPEDLSRILDSMECESNVDRNDLLQLQEELSENDEPHNIFFGVTALFIDNEGRPAQNKLLHLRLLLLGGKTVNEFTEEVTHLICCSDYCSLRSQDRKNRYLVTQHWVHDALNKTRRPNEASFIPKFGSKAENSA